MFASTVPVLLLVLLGVWLRRGRWTPGTFFPVIEWFSFYVAFPALLFVNTARLDVSATGVWSLAATTLLPTLLLTGLVLAALPLARRLPDPSRSSILQGAIRPSTYFGLSVASLLFEAEIAALVMLALAICLPAVNVIAVVALAGWSGQRVGGRRIARMVARNPIILAAVAGAAVNIANLPLPDVLANALGILGAASLALGLLCVGGGLEFRLAASPPLPLLLTSALKLLAFPALVVLLCRLAGADPAITVAACFYAALPTASNAYIMARQMGGDAPLMAALITVQTLLAMVTVPLVMRLPAWLPPG